MFETLAAIASNSTVQVIWAIILPTILGIYIKMYMSYRNAQSFFGVGGTGTWIAESTPVGTEACQIIHVGFTFIKLQCLDSVKYVHTISFKKRPWKFLDPMGIIQAKKLFLERAEYVKQLNLSGENSITQKQIQDLIKQLKTISTNNKTD